MSNESETSLDLAYDFAKKSYDTAFNRIDSLDRLIQGLLTFLSAITIAIPSFMKYLYPQVDLDSEVLFLIAFVFLASAVAGVVGLHISGITVNDPKVLSKPEWLDLPSQEFKKNILDYSAEHFERNRAILRRKGYMASFLIIGLLSQFLTVVLWIAFKN